MCEIEQKPLPLRNGGIFLGPGVKEIPKVCQRNPHDPKLAPAYARACVPASMSLGKRMHQHMHEHMSMHASTRANMHEHMSLHASSWPTVRGPANREPSAPQLEPRGARPADLDLGQRSSTSTSGARPAPHGPRPEQLDRQVTNTDHGRIPRAQIDAPRTMGHEPVRAPETAGAGLLGGTRDSAAVPCESPRHPIPAGLLGGIGSSTWARSGAAPGQKNGRHPRGCRPLADVDHLDSA